MGGWGWGEGAVRSVLQRTCVCVVGGTQGNSPHLFPGAQGAGGCLVGGGNDKGTAWAPCDPGRGIARAVGAQRPQGTRGRTWVLAGTHGSKKGAWGSHQEHGSCGGGGVGTSRTPHLTPKARPPQSSLDGQDPLGGEGWPAQPSNIPHPWGSPLRAGARVGGWDGGPHPGPWRKQEAS